MPRVLIVIGDATECLDTMYPYFRLPEDGFEPDTLVRWVREKKPDAVISMHAELIEWLREIPNPRPLLVSLDHNRRWGNCPGIDQKPQSIGAAAVDLLARQLQWNESGVPAEPLTILIDGKWRDGHGASSGPASLA